MTSEIVITDCNGYKRMFRYLEDVAEYMTRLYERDVYVTDIENQVCHPHEGCDIIVFGDKYQLKLNEYEED